MRLLTWSLCGALLLGLAGIWAMGPDWRRMVLSAPTNTNVLFWRLDQRDAAFRMMDRVGFLISARAIPAGARVRALDKGTPLQLDLDLNAYMRDNRTAAIVVLENGKIRLEAYGLDFTETGRWTSFSVAKSFTSTLVGAALKDGYIASLQDPVSKYITGLAGSAYDDVTIAHLLTMSSGVAWNEDYEDPSSDVALFNAHVAADGGSNLVSYMSRLKRAHSPGAVWNYSTGETNMIGVLVQQATGKNLADYLSEKIWQPYGMQQDASWLLNSDGTEISGCCIQAATRDFARFGQFMLEGANTGQGSILPDDWIAQATTSQMSIGEAGAGYGYQWWTFDDGSYAANGIFGQGILIDPARQLVIASNSSWTSATGLLNGERAGRSAFYKHVQDAIDRETAH